MAKFTSTVELNIWWRGIWQFVGAAGTEFSLPDSLQDEFDSEFSGVIPGLTWTEVTSNVTLPVSQSDVTNLVSDLAGKAATVHTHSESSVTNLTTDLAGKLSTSGGTVSGNLTVTGAARFKGTPWFDAVAYGATGDGSTDDTASVQLALDAAHTAGGGVVYLPAGTYKIATSPLSVYSNTSVQGIAGRTIIVGSHSVAARAVFTAGGTLGSLTTLASNASRGDNSIVLSASASAFSADDIVWLQSEAATNGVGTKIAELCVVGSVSGSTITVAGRIHASYLTADTAKAGRVTPVRHVEFRGLTIRNALYTATTTATGPLIDLSLVVGVVIRDCNLYENNGKGINLYDCLGVTVTGNVIEKLRDDEANSIFGYGVDVAQASRLVAITGNVFRNCRHGVTNETSASGATPSYGVARTITIAGNAVADCTAAGLDSHEEGDGITFSGNTVTGCDYVGIQVRAIRASVTGNTINNIRGIGIYAASSASAVTISGNNIGYIRQNANTATNGYGIRVDSGYVAIGGNYIEWCDSHGIALLAGTIAHLVVGNVILNNGQLTTGDGINVAVAATRVVLSNNIISDSQTSKTQRYGIRFESSVTNSDRIAMVGNIMSNHVSGEFSNAGTGTPQTWANGDTDAPGSTQRTRVSTGSIVANATSSISVSWPVGSFIDTNYSVFATVEDSNNDLRVLNVTSKAVGSATVRVQNTNGSNARTGTLHVFAIHD